MAASEAPGHYFLGPQQPRAHPKISLEWTPRIFEDQGRITTLLLSATASTVGGPTILPIVGPGGIGKTRLARLVIEHLSFKDYSKAWVTVWGQLSLPEIESSIIYQLATRYGSVASHGKRLDELMGGGYKKVLVVLDGLWEKEDSSRLEDLKRMLGAGLVIVTTRSQNIAKKICTMEPYKLIPDMCWAIKQTYQLALEDTNSPINRVLQSLKQSYQWMPSDLQSCFAYCAMFPEGHSIGKYDLIHQWIALDLVEPSDSLAIRQQLGEEYIRMLLDISFLQPTKSALNSEKDISYTMHAVVHALARSIAGDKLIVQDGRSTINQDNTYCRFALITNFDMMPLKLASMLPAELSALYFLGCGKMELSDDSLSFAKLLQILHLTEQTMQTLPDSICQLKHLTYINLSGCSGLIQLPTSLGNLSNVVRINLSGCSGLLQLPNSLGNLTNVAHINLSGCSGLLQLPNSLGNLTNVAHINLSGCSGLLQLPNSFGNLTNVVHVNLSGCSGLEELPESIGNLINVVHINLAGCSKLVKLPKSFYKLIEVMHISLSGSYGLEVFPESIGKLKKLVHLDLSLFSCFEGIPNALSGLTNLEYLDLSRPCRYLDEHKPLDEQKSHLMQLTTALGTLINLRHLNLSMFLNHIFCYLTEDEGLQYIGSIGCLSKLEYLDMSHNIFLFDLPESLCDLSHLHTIDLSGCIRLKTVVKWICRMKCLKTVVMRNCQSLGMYLFVVHADDGSYSSNIVQLEDVISCKDLEICCLEKVKSVMEAKRIRLVKKRNLRKLALGWSLTAGHHGLLAAEALLAELVPPQSLRCLELHGYSGKCFPTWLMTSISSILPNLEELTMSDIPWCSDLPPLGLLPNLKVIILRRMLSIKSIELSVFSGSKKEAFHQLSQFTLDEMESLEEFSTTYYSGHEKLVFPKDKLVIHKCSKLKYSPGSNSSPAAVCQQAMTLMTNREGDGVEEGPSSSTFTASA